MNIQNRFVCIHGHFYQPPRENAWLESVELQESAAPFHDWNARINSECYAPNTASRILDQTREISDIVNNYSLISFNFGPTLLSWLELNDSTTYHAILEADKESLKTRNGHGNAVAQVHSHLILPLANAKDKFTQIYWGIADFEHRFKRKPEGIWLAETAANTDTLEALAEQGIKYTILAPRQAKSIKLIAENQWRDLGAFPIDTRLPYLCRLPSGKEIALFFYNGTTAQEVAFNGLLNDGKRFGERAVAGLDSNPTHPQLAHIATDGESYGHHHRYGEMALSFCLNHIEKNGLAKLTNYGEFLANNPPIWEVKIHENSSWSCVHGVERWRNDCGCNSGGKPEWNQRWRAPLRESLDWLRDTIAPLFETEGNKLFKDAWLARNEYIEVILNRAETNVDAFLAKHTVKPLSASEKVRALRLLEMQRNALYMYTSCGWFFDEVSGIETNQILQYACRAIDYAAQTTGVELENLFLKKLQNIPSNVPQLGNAAESYRHFVLPSKINLERVGMHFATASIFEPDPEDIQLFNYTVQNDFWEKRIAGSQVLVMGRTTVKSKITLSEKKFSFAALYLGQHNLIGSISTEMTAETFEDMKKLSSDAFHNGNLSELITITQRYFGSEKFSMQRLFKDEKNKILVQVFENQQKELSRYFHEIYADNYQLMLAFGESGIEIPRAYKTAVAYVLNEELKQFIDDKKLKLSEFNRLVKEFELWKVKPLELKRLGLSVTDRLLKELDKIKNGETSVQELQTLNQLLKSAAAMKFDFDKWQLQNKYFFIVKNTAGLPFSNAEWVEQFKILGINLGMKV